MGPKTLQKRRWFGQDEAADLFGRWRVPWPEAVWQSDLAANDESRLEEPEPEAPDNQVTGGQAPENVLFFELFLGKKGDIVNFKDEDLIRFWLVFV